MLLLLLSNSPGRHLRSWQCCKCLSKIINFPIDTNEIFPNPVNVSMSPVFCPSGPLKPQSLLTVPVLTSPQDASSLSPPPSPAGHHGAGGHPQATWENTRGRILIYPISYLNPKSNSSPINTAAIGKLDELCWQRILPFPHHSCFITAVSLGEIFHLALFNWNSLRGSLLKIA